MHGLGDWQSFYVLVGSSAGALIGLQFVVMALIAEQPSVAGLAEATSAFGTPNIVHFATSLLVAAVLSAPWSAFALPAFACGMIGVAGVVYISIAARRLGRQTLYAPVLSDWAFYVLLPLAGHAALAAFGFAAACGAQRCFFGIAAGALLLLFVGIHNAWDSVTYHIFSRRQAGK